MAAILRSLPRGRHWCCRAPGLSCTSLTASTRRRPGAAAAKGGAGTADAMHWIPQENREEVAHILDMAERAAARWSVTTTDFLSPPVAADAMSCLQGRGDVVAVPWGGYAQAERCRLLLGREEIIAPLLADPLQSNSVMALEVKGNFMFDPAKHPDFLGAVLGTGVVRGKVGDIIVQGEAGAQILCDPDLAEHFVSALTQVRTVPVQVRSIPLTALSVRAPQVEEISAFEASLRLDALASAGFRISRSKMTDLVKGGDVRVNWRPCARPSQELKEGDIIACAGKGRIEIKSVATTKRERFQITILRYT